MACNRGINHAELRRQVEINGARKTLRHLSESLEQGALRPDDFSVRELAEAFMGREWVSQLNPKSGRFVSLQEAADASAVHFSHFSNITGQIFFSAVKEAYEDEEFVFSKVVPTKPSDIADVEKIPGITQIGDEAVVVEEGGQYPQVGVGEDYIEVAAKKKRGFIVPVTKEAIRFDRTGILLDRCKRGGFYLGLNKEKRVIDCVIDENAGAASIVAGGHRYHWKGTSYATYQTSTPWDNVTASAGLTDWTDVNEAWLTLAAMTDPYTGEPILIQPDTLIVTPDNLWIANRILSATEVRSGDITTGSGHQMISGNPVKNALGSLKILSSRLLKARAATDTDWWLGNPARAFAYFSNWDITPEEAGANSEAAFSRDIVAQYKISEMGAAATLEPRLMTECRA